MLVQENATVNGDTVSFPPGAVKAGDNRRLAGEDLTVGKPALPAGKLLRPADLGLLASLGIAEIAVRRKLRVAFFPLVMNCVRWAKCLMKVACTTATDTPCTAC